MPIKKELVDDFGEKIKAGLRVGFDNYSSGNEIEFIDDFLDEIDNTVAKGGGQHLHTKTKNIHGYPQADFDTSISSHPTISSEIIDQIEDKTPEIADLLVILNVYENGSVEYRRAFFSQAKCVRSVRIGYQYWKIDSTQYYFLRERPVFKLGYKDSDTEFDIRGISTSAMNYSFVGDVHRPFFYRPENMIEYLRSMANNQRFVYGTNPVIGFRLPISVLKNLLFGRFGEQFTANSEMYNLIAEIYDKAEPVDSNSSNAMPDGGTEGANRGSGMGILEINVDADGYYNGEIPPASEESLRVDNITDE